MWRMIDLYLFLTHLLNIVGVLFVQQPQSPKEQPKKGDQKGDDTKKQGGECVTRSPASLAGSEVHHTAARLH